MKDTYYFSHDYNTRTDAKIKRLLSKHGMLGYGVFWSIIEDLYNNANALPTDYESIAFDLRTNEMIVKSIVNDFDLFIIDGELFGSISVQRRLDERNEKSTKARESANKRWNKTEKDANALQTQCEPNAIKESKLKEIKEKKETIFESLWKNYPNKDNKKKAKEKFLKLDDKDIELVKIHLPIFSVTKKFATYNHPQLIVYLNQERFRDEIVKSSSIIPTTNLNLNPMYNKLDPSKTYD
jgi:uncharacterized protein YdaU (DUF1376 family)